MTFSNQSRIGVNLDQQFSSAQRTGVAGVSATACASDWRKIEPGDVFVALDNGVEDGHDHAHQAVQRGATAILCERPVPVFSVPTYMVPDSRIALGQLCHALVDHPTQTLPTIGVTGTQGKSTTIALLEAIFCAAGKQPGKISTLGCYDGMTHSAGCTDEPTQPEIALRLARMGAAGCTHALLEVSSPALAQNRLAGATLDAVVVTNITSAHLDLHHSTENYRKTTRRVLEQLSPEGVTVLNADDPASMQWLDGIEGPVLTYGLGDQAEVRGRVLHRQANEQTFVITAGNDSAAISTAIVGDHHVSNCLAAATVALSYGITLQQIATGIESLDRLDARMERVECGQGFPVYVDAAKTPDALRASLRTARQLASGRVLCVVDEGALLDVAMRMADLTIAIDRQEDFCELPGHSHRNTDEVQIASDRGEAIAWVVAMAEPGDVVVITGSQPQPTLSFGHKDTSDVEVARELLYARNKFAGKLAA